jgi:hypothetical protein
MTTERTMNELVLVRLLGMIAFLNNASVSDAERARISQLSVHDMLMEFESVHAEMTRFIDKIPG